MGKKIDHLWRKIEKENIKVRYGDISNIPERLYGMYLYLDGIGHVVVLDKSLLSNYILHRCTLVHELGHYFTGAQTNLLYTSTSYATEIERSRDEYRAMKWAAHYLMPNHEVYDAIKKYNIKNPQDLAEFFQVTIELCMSKLTFIKQELHNHGIFIKGRGMFNVSIWPTSMREK